MSETKDKEGEATGKAIVGCFLLTVWLAGVVSFLTFSYIVDWRIGVAATGFFAWRVSAKALEEL